MKKYINAVKLLQDYILNSEMEGKIDISDSWYSTYENLEELKQKMITEKELLK